MLSAALSWNFHEALYVSHISSTISFQHRDQDWSDQLPQAA
jgi:hypothetical protein